MKSVLLTFLIVCFSMNSFAQKLPKIKGDKNVVTVADSLPNFNSISVKNSLPIYLRQADENGYELKVDQNLVDIIKFKVIDQTLEISSINTITSSKSLEIVIYVTQLEKLELEQNTAVTSINKLEFKDFRCELGADAKADLDLIAKKATFGLSKNASLTIDAKADELNFLMSNTASLDGSIVADLASFSTLKRAKMSLTGDVKNLNLTASGHSTTNFKKLIARKANVTSSEDADIHIYTNYLVRIFAQGDSVIYLYGQPEVEIDGLSDTAQLIKK